MEEKPIILKEQIQDSIQISKLIIEKGLEGKKLSQVEDAEENRDIYNEFISPALKLYKSKYNNMSPNMIMNDFLKKYKVKNNLDNYLSKGLKFYGQKLISYEWACIYKGDPLIKKRHYSYSPQLFILINKAGIKFGFSYGTEVNNDDECVEAIKEDEAFRERFLDVLKRNEKLKFYSNSFAEEPPDQRHLVKINNSEDLEISWDEKTHIISYYPEDLIPDDISEKIEEIFDELLYLFKKASLLEIKDPLEAHCIDILKSVANKNSEINYEKTLEITELLVKKLKDLNIERSPLVIVFSAALLWHNVFNRLNDSEYLMQEDLNKIFEGGLGAVRYLRNELGINERKYENIEELIIDLEKSSFIEGRSSKNVLEMRVYDIVANKIIGRDKINQSAVETVVFLYFKKEKSYTKNEIWDGIKNFIKFEGDTPSHTFNSDLSRYTDNSEVDVSTKRSPLLFTITNIGEKTHELQLIDSIRKKIEDFEKETPYVWQMIREATENLGEQFSNTDIKNYIFEKYGDINENTIDTQIIICTVNHDSRIHNQENKTPRIANSKYDFLYRIEKGKGELELYDPKKHGIWEIKADEEGKLMVSQMKEEQDKSLETIYEGIALINEINEALLLKGQIILMGPPGTSKSYLAEQIALQITKGKVDNIEMVQFHPSYSYEDFVECNIIERGEIKPKAKKFRNFCKKASKEENNCVLIIDEINRGNVERIFGELIYGLERRNKKISTVYFEDALTIPDNLYLIGTMNTVDLSIANIDAALRRRFYIIEIEPNKNILENWLKYHLGDKFFEFQKDLVEFMENLNEKIENHELMGKFRKIGHAVFMLKAIIEKLELKKIRENVKMEWKYMIRPTILEYLNFPDDEELKQFDALFEEFSKKDYNI